eukprot:COSAG01_NODE_8643_length_2710_cov_3.390272_2_plen_80_part_00
MLAWLWHSGIRGLPASLLVQLSDFLSCKCSFNVVPVDLISMPRDPCDAAIDSDASKVEGLNWHGLHAVHDTNKAHDKRA